MKFLVDENFFTCLKFILDEWGHDADAVNLRPSLIHRDDDIVLRTAASEDRIVVTFDTDDYMDLHEQYQAQGLDHAGIVVCRNVATYAGFHNVVRWMRNLLNTAQSSPDFRNQIHYLHTHN